MDERGTSREAARMTADYFIVTTSTRQPMVTLGDAYRQAYRLLMGGASEVEIRQVRLTADCWGPARSEEGLLHRFVPAEHPIAPTAGVGSTATFPPYAWRWLQEVPQQPPPMVEPVVPVVEEQPQQLGIAFG